MLKFCHRDNHSGSEECHTSDSDKPAHLWEEIIVICLWLSLIVEWGVPCHVCTWVCVSSIFYKFSLIDLQKWVQLRHISGNSRLFPYFRIVFVFPYLLFSRLDHPRDVITFVQAAHDFIVCVGLAQASLCKRYTLLRVENVQVSCCITCLRPILLMG